MFILHFPRAITITNVNTIEGVMGRLWFTVKVKVTVMTSSNFDVCYSYS
jgi:hypothetical protein